MTGGYKTVAVTVAYEAISSRLKMLPNSAKATSEFQDTTLYTVQRLTAISVYFNELLDGQGRMQASTTAAKVLRKVAPKALASVSLRAIQGFERRCHRYMEVYQHGLPPHLAEFAVKKYSSHRHVPSEYLLATIEAEYTAKSK